MIEVRGAHKELGEFSLRGVDLRIETGEYFVILGPTGAGKTVLLEAIAGLHRLDEGEVWLEDREVTNLPTELRNVGYVPQDYVLFPHISLRDNIGFSLSVRGTPSATIERRTQELSELLGIAHLLDRRVRTLSGGEQQRGALARALAPKPTVLLLDEPLSALDEGTRAELSVELTRISRELRTTVIHVCHNFDEALELADRLAIMHQGQVLQVGPPALVFRKPVSRFVARFVGAQNLFPAVTVDRKSSTVTLEGGVRLQVGELPEGEGLLAMIRPEDLMIEGGRECRECNAIACQVEEVRDRGRLVHIHLRGPVPLLATMTRQAFASLGISEGEAVTVHFRPESVHVFAE